MARLELKKRTLDEIGQRGRLISLIDPHPEGRGEELPAWIWALIVLVSIGALLVLALFIAPEAKAQERGLSDCLQEDACAECYFQALDDWLDCLIAGNNGSTCITKITPSFRLCVWSSRETDYDDWLRRELPQWAEQ